MNVDKLQSCARQASILLKAMSNEHRLLILSQLLDGEKSVGELVRTVGLSQSALSQHLARLRRDHLVRTRREAQTIYYTVTSDEALAILDQVYRLYGTDQPPPRAAGHGGGHAAEAHADGHAGRRIAVAHP